MRVSGKVAVVTGGGGGIAAALAGGLAEQGAHVVLADLDPSALARSPRRWAESPWPWMRTKSRC